VATLAKELVLMGSGMYANTAGINTIDGRKEFNWWFDPEAVRIAMRAPWEKDHDYPYRHFGKNPAHAGSQGSDR
jgi:inosine-uridine nucleoside N-ribohydrolase